MICCSQITFQCFLWTTFCSPAVKASGSCMGARGAICSYCCITVRHSKVTIIQNKIRILFSKLLLILAKKGEKSLYRAQHLVFAKKVTEQKSLPLCQYRSSRQWSSTLRNVKNNLEPSVCKSAYCSLYNYCYCGEMRESWIQEPGYETGN